MSYVAVPTLRSFSERGVLQAVDALTRNVQILTGDGDYGVISRRGALNAGLITAGGGGYTAANPLPSMVVPPAPTGLAAVSSFTIIHLTWDSPPYANHAVTEIWRASSDDVGAATRIGTTQGYIGVYADSVGSTGTPYYYWIRFVSVSGHEGPFNAVAGVFSSTTYIGNTDLGPLIVTASKLASNSVDMQKLSVSFSANLVNNSEFLKNLNYWDQGAWSTPNSNFGVNLSADWMLEGSGTAYIYQTDAGATGVADVVSISVESAWKTAQVVGGKWYQASVYTGAHRCSGTINIAFYDSNNAWITELAGTTNNQEAAGGKYLSGYKRLFLCAQAPANAVYALAFVRKFPTIQGQGYTNSYLFFTRMHFGEAVPNQTEPSPWVPAGVTYMDGAQIRNLSVGNAAIANLAVDNAKIASVAADKITAGTITASISITSPTINGGTITGATLRTAASGRRFIASTWDNDARFYGDNGNGTPDALLATVGLTTTAGGVAVLSIGASNMGRTSIFAESLNNHTIFARANGYGDAINATAGLGSAGVFSSGYYGLRAYTVQGNTDVAAFYASASGSPYSYGVEIVGGASRGQMRIVPESFTGKPTHWSNSGTVYMNSFGEIYINPVSGIGSAAWGLVPHSKCTFWNILNSPYSGGYWYPPAGFYNFFAIGASGNSAHVLYFEIYANGQWNQAQVITGVTSSKAIFFAWCDGVNMRFYSPYNGSHGILSQMMGRYAA